jgi:type I restriction enzyme S subunit
MSTAPNIALEHIMAPRLGSIDPSAFPDEEFDLYSIPAFDRGEAEVLPGSAIGSAKQIVQPGDVLLSRIVPHIRRAWVVGHARARRIIASGEWIVFRDENVDPRYLRHVLVSDPFHAEFMRTVSGVGGSLLRARPAYVAKIKIPLPPLPEQRRIAEILDKADALRAKGRAAIAQLDTLTQSIFLDMFGDPATNPKGCTTKSLTSVCQCYSGGTPSKRESRYWAGDLPWFSPKDLKQDDLFDSEDHVNEAVLSETNLKLLPPNTVAIVVRGMILAHTFPVSVIRVPATINQDLKALLPNNGIELDPQVLAHCLRVQSRAILASVSESAHGTKRLDAEALAKIAVVLPSGESQREFSRRIARAEQCKVAQRTSLRQLDLLFASLQHRAFLGDLWPGFDEVS